MTNFLTLPLTADTEDTVQRPLSEMADRGYEAGTDEAGYILHEFKAFANVVSNQIEQASTRSELQSIWRSCEHLFANKGETTSALQVLANKIERASTKADLQSIWRSCEHLFASKSETTSALQLLANKIEGVDELKANLMSVISAPEQAATTQDLQAIWRSCEHLFASKSETASALQLLANKVEGIDDLKSNVMNLSSMYESTADLKSSLVAALAVLEQKATHADLVAVSNFVSSEIDRAKTNVVDLTVTTAQVKALNATPVQLLPAPGAGKYLEVIRMEIFLDYATTAYAGDAGKDLSLEYSSSGQVISVPATGIFNLSADQRRCLNHSTTHLVGVNEALMLKMTVGELTLGDSPLKVRLDYRIVDVLT